MLFLKEKVNSRCAVKSNCKSDIVVYFVYVKKGLITLPRLEGYGQIF